jgi:uncharacterized membrane protein
VHAAATGDYWPVAIAIVALALAVIFGLDAFGVSSSLSRRLSGQTRARWTGIDPFGIWQVRLVLGAGLLIIAIGVVVLT